MYKYIQFGFEGIWEDIRKEWVLYLKGSYVGLSLLCTL